MVKLFKKIKNIILGWWFDFTGENYWLMKDRMEICEKCDSCKYITRSTPICCECGCPLKKKTRVKDESCLLNKW